MVQGQGVGEDSFGLRKRCIYGLLRREEALNSSSGLIAREQPHVGQISVGLACSGDQAIELLPPVEHEVERIGH